MYSLPQSYNQTSKCKRCICPNAYAYGPFADYLRKHPFHHSQVERNDMGTFTSFDYTLLVTDELVDEILALGDKVEITFPEKLRMKLLQKIGRIRNRYMVI